MSNPFEYPTDRYQRDLNVLDAYYNDTARYLQLSTGTSFEECLTYVKNNVGFDKPIPLKNPRCRVLVKNAEGDREQNDTMTFMDFLGKVVTENLIISPSMAVYLPESERQSTHALYIKEGVVGRKNVKKKMFTAIARRDFEEAKILDGEQEYLKINNNSYSGATVSGATILYYKSTHSSLTSTCRAATSYANATNEKFIMGNRHYYTPEITRANLLSIVNQVDMELIATVVQTYQLYYPTVDDVMECVYYSTKNYWEGTNATNTIRQMVSGMTPNQRAAVVYCGDLYHLHKHNPTFVISFLTGLAKVSDDTPRTTDETFGKLHEDLRLMANFLCYERVKGREKDQILSDDPATWEHIKNTAYDAQQYLTSYELLFKGLWLTPIMPSSIHAIPTVYRKCVVISDTDSTMFSVQYWLTQCTGSINFESETKRLGFAMVFIISQLVSHIMAMLSANMGVSRDKMRMLAMKNEYYFSVLALTGRSKHYFASQDAREGLMFDKYKMEIKGVGLRDSKVPKRITEGAKKMMERIVDMIKSCQPIDIRALLTEVGDIERSIFTSIASGSSEFMTKGQIKSENSYKNGKDNPQIQQHHLWKTVFAPTYGTVTEPPYSVVKVSLMISNKTYFEQWCQKIEDKALVERLRAWWIDKRKNDLNTMLIPAPIVETMGIPPTIIQAVDARSIIYNTMGVYYIILEALGIFVQDKHGVRLISDYY